MASIILHESIKNLLKKDSFLTQADIAKKLKKDKVRIGGFLDAMVEYGDLSLKKLGNSKVYFISNNDEV